MIAGEQAFVATLNAVEVIATAEVLSVKVFCTWRPRGCAYGRRVVADSLVERVGSVVAVVDVAVGIGRGGQDRNGFDRRNFVQGDGTSSPGFQPVPAISTAVPGE